MIIPAGFCQVNFVFTGEGAPSGAEITLGLEYNSGDSPSQVAQDCADAWSAEDLDALYVDALTLSAILVKFGPNSTGPSAELAVSVPGTASGAAVPPNTSMVISKITALGGRKGRGRMFFPGINEGAVSSAGILDGALVSGSDSRWTDFAATLALAGHGCVLLHNDLTAPTPITEFATQARAATQRRRLRR